MHHPTDRIANPAPCRIKLYKDIPVVEHWQGEEIVFIGSIMRDRSDNHDRTFYHGSLASLTLRRSIRKSTY